MTVGSEDLHDGHRVQRRVSYRRLIDKDDKGVVNPPLHEDGARESTTYDDTDREDNGDKGNSDGRGDDNFHHDTEMAYDPLLVPRSFFRELWLAVRYRQSQVTRFITNL